MTYINPWTDERVESLKSLWSDGVSATRIGKLLGGVTRSTIIGKVHRLGLSGRKKTPTGRPPKPKASADKGNGAIQRVKARRRQKDAPPLMLVEAEPEPDFTDDTAIPFEQRCTLLELTDETCRWPVGDPGTPQFFFCGGPKITSFPYCAHHCRVAYNPVPVQKRPFVQLRNWA